MNHRLAKRALVSFVVLAFFSSVGLLAAQGRGPQSLQPDLSAVFVTLAMRHDTPVARGHILLLPSPSRRAIVNRPSSGGGIGSTTAVSTSANALTVSGSSYSVGLTFTPTTTQPEAEEEIAADQATSATHTLCAPTLTPREPSISRTNPGSP